MRAVFGCTAVLTRLLTAVGSSSDAAQVPGAVPGRKLADLKSSLVAQQLVSLVVLAGLPATRAYPAQRC